MNNLNALHKHASLLMAILLMMSTFAVPVSAEEDDLYGFNRDGNGEPLYLYQSPCMLGYDIDKQHGGNGVPIQAFVFTMYNKRTGEHFPTYCTDINTTAVQGMDYRRMNLEYSPFAGSVAGKIRAILQNGFFIIPIDGESEADHAVRVAAKTANLGAAADVKDLTTGEAIAATQAAIWRAANGSKVSFPKFCRYVFNPTETKYTSLCSYNELRYKNTVDIHTRIEKVYKHLTALPPLAATSSVVSASSFLKMENLVISNNGDDTCTVSVDVTVDVDMATGDKLELYTTLNEKSSEPVSLSDGEQTKTLSINDVPAADVSGNFKLFVSGTQTVSGFFYFDPEVGHEVSQAMVGYDSSQQPVYIELTAAPKEGNGGEPVFPDNPDVPTGGINLLKVDAENNKPLAGATFAVYRPATTEEINGSDENLVEIPGVAAKMVKVSFYDNSNLTGEQITTITTGEDGKTAIYGLPYGTYYLVETEAPAGYNLLTDSKEFTIDANSHMESNMITIENKIGVLLPSTGGVGTTVYTVCGMALVCIPCLFLYRNKQKKMEI